MALRDAVKGRAVAIDGNIFAHKSHHVGREPHDFVAKLAGDVHDLASSVRLIFDGYSVAKKPVLEERAAKRRRKAEETAARAAARPVPFSGLAADLQRSLEKSLACQPRRGQHTAGAAQAASPEVSSLEVSPDAVEAAARALAPDFPALFRALREADVKFEVAQRVDAEHLCTQSEVVLSEDFDVLAYGGHTLVTRVGFGGPDAQVVVYERERILRDLGLNLGSFRLFCVLCGSDFCARIPGIGPVRALKLVRRFGTLDELRLATEERRPGAPRVASIAEGYWDAAARALATFSASACQPGSDSAASARDTARK